MLCLWLHTHKNFFLFVVSCSNCSELFQQHILFFSVRCWKFLALAEQKLYCLYNTTKNSWQELHQVTAAEEEWPPFSDEYQPTVQARMLRFHRGNRTMQHRFYVLAAGIVTKVPAYHGKEYCFTFWNKKIAKLLIQIQTLREILNNMSTAS
jgi:hypothetical protein